MGYIPAPSKKKKNALFEIDIKQLYETIFLYNESFSILWSPQSYHHNKHLITALEMEMEIKILNPSNEK